MQYDIFVRAKQRNDVCMIARPDLLHDALGRRASKTVSGVTMAFLYDGDQLIAEYDAAGKLLARDVYGPGIDEPLVMLKTGKSYDCHLDRLYIEMYA